MARGRARAKGKSWGGARGFLGCGFFHLSFFFYGAPKHHCAHCDDTAHTRITLSVHPEKRVLPSADHTRDVQKGLSAFSPIFYILG